MHLASSTTNIMSVEDETLSFRDLPLYGQEWGEVEEDESSQGSTSISSDDYDFQFFSHQLFPPENIIFCGKIIPYKIPSNQIDHQQPTTSNKNRNKDNHQNTKKQKGSSSSATAKARWHLFFTGVSRFSGGMELRDIKTRQSRHCPPPSPAFRVQNYDEKISRSSSRLWEVVRVLSCGGNYHPNAMVVGSITCNRLQ